MNNLSEASEQVELNKILQSLLQVNGSLKRLNIETDEVFVVLPKSDWNYIVSVADQGKGHKFYKFYSKKESDNFFRLGGVSKAKDFISPYSVDQLSKKVYSPMLRLKQAIADVEVFK